MMEEEKVMATEVEELESKEEIVDSSVEDNIIDEAEKASYVLCQSFSIKADYSQYDKLLRLLEGEGARITDTQYLDTITVSAVIYSDKFYDLSEKIKEAFASKLFLNDHGSVIEAL